MNRSVFILSILLSITSYSQNKENYGLLYEISGNQMEGKSYLFGSMHVMDDRAFNFPDSLIDYIRACEVIAMEVNPDSILDEDDFEYIFNQYDRKKNSKTSDNVIIQKDSSSNETVVIKNSPNDVEENDSHKLLFTDEYKDYPTFVDTYLLGIGKRLGLETAGLEGNDINWSEYLQRNTDIMPSEKAFYEYRINQMLNTYEEGNVEELSAPFNNTLEDADLIDRNIVMANRIEKIGHKKPMFSIVGALHLSGSQSIVNILSERGYMVKKVPVNFSGRFQEQYQLLPEVKWNSFKLPNIGLQGQLPSQPVVLKNFPLDAIVSIDFQEMQFYFTMKITNPEKELKSHEFIASVLKEFKDSIYIQDSLSGNDENGFPFHQYNCKTSEYELIYRTVQCQNDFLFHTVLSMSKLNHDHARKYFNSVDVIPIEFENRFENWTDFQNLQGAYKVRFPTQPTQQRVVNEYEHLEVNNKEVAYLYSSTQNGSSYLVRHSDFPSGMILQDNKTLVEDFKNEYSFEQFIPYDSLKFSTPNGYLTAEGDAVKNGIYSKIRFLYRGNRFYLIMALTSNRNDAQKEAFNHFFNTFELTPINGPSEHPYSLGSATFPVAGKVEISGQSGYYYNNYDTVITLSVVDSTSSVSFSIEQQKMKKYYSVAQSDTLYQYLLNDYKEDGDSLIWDSLITSEIPAYVQYFENEDYGYNTINAIRPYENSFIYYFYYIPNEIEDPWVYLNAVTKFSANGKVEIFNDKIDLLNRDLNSGDSTLIEEALEGYNYVDRSEALDLELWKFFKNNESNSYQANSINYKVLEKFDYSTKNKDLIADSLYQFAIKNEIDQNGRYILLCTLDDLNENRASELLLNYIHSESIPIPDSTYDDVYNSIALYNLVDSLEWCRENYQELADLHPYKEYNNIFLFASSTIVENDSNANNYISGAESELTYIFDRGLEDAMDTSQYLGFQYDLYHFPDLIPYLPSFNSELRLVELMNSPISNYEKVDFVGLFKSFPELFKSVWADSLTKNSYNRYYFYQQVYQNSLENYFPKKHRNQEYVAKLAIVAALEDYWEEYGIDLEQFEFIEKVDLSSYEINGNAYVFTMEFSYEPGVKYLVLSGIQPEKKKEIAFNMDFCEFLYQQYDKNKYEQQKEELLQSALEFFRENN